MVVLGNPPYSNFGRMNRNPWILGLLADYKKGLKEKKLNIDDDFIKFIRFAQWRIETAFPKTKGGIIGFITNNTYLDGITHRHMRECLLETFNEIYVLNLHGNLRKKETAPNGGKDENVFDIQQGVAIALFVKQPNQPGCRVLYGDLWGEREGKYKTLWETDVAKTDWAELKPSAPYFFFAPKQFGAEEEYRSGWSIGELFTVWQNGLKTDRDDFSSILTGAHSLRECRFSTRKTATINSGRSITSSLPAVTTLRHVEMRRSLMKRMFASAFIGLLMSDGFTTTLSSRVALPRK